MAQIFEQLNGGLVTARDPILLQPGELSKCDNAIYKIANDGLNRPTALSLFDTIGGSARGLVVARFVNGNVYLLSQSGSLYVRSAAGPAAPFSSLAAATINGTLQATHHHDKYYLFNGLDPNLVLRNDGTSRLMGMQPVVESPGFIKNTVTGGWLNSLGWYEYWFTEVTEITENGQTVELESTFTGVPANVNITSLNTTVTIPRPTVVNSSRTKWRVYRSAVKDDSSITLFPVGGLIGTLDISTATFTDGIPFDTGWKTVGANSSGAAAWVIPSNVQTSNDSYATLTEIGTGVFAATRDYHTIFGASPAIPEPIVGIEVEIEAKAISTGDYAGIAYLQVYLTAASGTVSAAKTTVLTNTDKTTTLGGPTDKWGMFFRTSDFADPNFKLSIKGITVGVSVGGVGSMVIYVDFIRIKVYYGGAALDPISAFPAVTATFNNVEAPVGEDGPPPISTAGTVYQDALVLTDVANKRYLRFSAAAKPESFPASYFIDMEEAQDVVAPYALGDRLLAFLTGQTWRINYLPNEDDAFISRGILKDQIDPANGAVSPEAITIFPGQDGRTEVAFVSTNGLMATDGIITRMLTDDLDWKALVPNSQSSQCRLINNPERHELVLYFSDGAGADKALYFNYHPRHIKSNGKLKVSGPVRRWWDGSADYVKSAAVYTTPLGASTVYTAYDRTGRVNYDNDAGTAFQMFPDIRTRRMNFAGWGMEFATVGALLQHAACATAFIATPYTIKTGAAEVTQATKALSINFLGQTHIPFPRYTTEGFRLGISAASVPAPFQFDYVVFDVPNAEGKEDSQKA